MKTILSLLAGALICSVLFCSYSPAVKEHNTLVIGEMQGDDPVITLSETVIADSWEAVLANEGITVELASFEIVTLREGDYNLIGRDSDTIGLAAISIVLEGGKFYERLYGGNGLTVNCSGCAEFVDYCQPSIVNGKGYCRPYCLDCLRSVTLLVGAAVITQ